MATATPVQPETLRTLPSDTARQVQWGFADRYDLQLLVQSTTDLKSSYANGSSICLAGSHGLGKTMTATCILKKACQKNFSCLYTTLSDIVNVLTTAPGEDRYLAKRELALVDFLVIDEFDSRFMPSENAADLYARSLESVFRVRSSNRLPTIMCTNSPNVVESFNGPLKASIDSLMKGYLKVFPVLGDDFRKKRVS